MKFPYIMQGGGGSNFQNFSPYVLCEWPLIALKKTIDLYEASNSDVPCIGEKECDDNDGEKG